ncbi:MAG: hypothetical protein FWB85_09495 [Chitinispirillia bacterium]|nr:hypothetical protein [Chitinispirillia bacterium]MCL2242413.1 hypothetical protein [Chitinispirillia bacterium]
MLKHLIRIGLVLPALFTFGWILGCSNPSENDEEGGTDGLDSKLIGDWLVVSECWYSDYDDYEDCWGPEYNHSFGLITFKPSGESVITYFARREPYWDIQGLAADAVLNIISGGTLGSFKRENGFWMELAVSNQWRTENQKIYFMENWESYNISETTLTIRGRNWSYTLKKDNLAATKGRLGTIRTIDPDLYDSPYSYWELSTDQDVNFGIVAELAEDGIWFSSDWVGGYWFNGEFGEGELYTVGSRLFLLEELWGIDCDSYCDGLALVKTHEIDYKITSVNGVKTLTMRPVGLLGILGPEDVWTLEKWDDDYDYSPAKSRAISAKRPNNIFKTPFQARHSAVR